MRIGSGEAERGPIGGINPEIAFVPAGGLVKSEKVSPRLRVGLKLRGILLMVA